MKRRSFLKYSSTASIPVLVGGFQVNSIASSPVFDFINEQNDKVLVLIQCLGGMDGLHTVFPIDQYNKLVKVRENVIIPENVLLPVTDSIKFHPVMSGMKNVFDEGNLSIIQSVGYPNQNRSHFRSKDIWNTASRADEYLTSGWLGRYLDDSYPGYPTEYPNEENKDPFAITIGSIVSETCQGLASNFSMALKDPFALTPLSESGNSELPDNYYGDNVEFMRTIIAQTNAYGDQIKTAAEKGNNLSNKYPDDNSLAQQLKQVALLIAGGLKTKIYVVNLGGFDLHANLTDANDSTTGRHTVLLDRLSGAIDAFVEDLSLLGVQDRVLGMTFTEFGRRIKANESFGTDHGSAAPMFLFGPCINKQVVGHNPEIPEEVKTQDGVPMQHDFRSVYGTILEDWFEVPKEKVKEYLFDGYQKMDFLKDCNVPELNPFTKVDTVSKFYPNPAKGFINLVFQSQGEMINVELFDMTGHLLNSVPPSKYPKGKHSVRMNLLGLPSGNYFYRIRGQGWIESKIFVKL
jgi:uncharacterized protein (DUF1501 family)